MSQRKTGHIKNIIRAGGLVMALFALSRLLGVMRDVVIAAQFGTSAPYDAYLAAFKLPDLLFNVISGGALTSAFLPTFTGYLANDDRDGAWRVASAIINWVLLLGSAVAIIAALLAPQLVRGFIAPGFSDPAQIALTITLMRWLLISTVVFGVSGVLMGILNGQQQFLFPALAPVVYNLGIIGGAIWLGPTLGVRGLAVGVVVGSLGHLAIQLPSVIRSGMHYQLILAPRDPGVREVVRLMGPRVVGIAAVQFNFIWDTFLASWLSAGSLTSLDFGRRVMLLPQGIIAQAVATAAFPTFSALAAQKAWGDMQDAFTATVRSVLYLTIPASIGLLLLGQPIIESLYQRNAFTAESTRNTVWALWFYSIGLVAHAVIEILTRAFYSLHNTKTPVLVGIIAMVSNILLSVLLMFAFAGVNLAPHGGIALASSLAVLGEMVWLMIALKRQPGALSVAQLRTPTLKFLLAGAAMTLTLVAWNLTSRHWNSWLQLMGGMVLGGGIYLALTYALGSEEPRLLVAQLRRRLGR